MVRRLTHLGFSGDSRLTLPCSSSNPLSCKPQSDVIRISDVGCSPNFPLSIASIGSRTDLIAKIAQCAPKLVQRLLIQTCRLNGGIRPLGVPEAS